MKTKFILPIIALFSATTFAQKIKSEVTKMENLPIVYMQKGVNIHFVSPEPIQFVDLSTHNLIGDLPTNTIARVKIMEEPPQENNTNKNHSITLSPNNEIGIITIVGQSFMAQYKAVLNENSQESTATNIYIQGDDIKPLDFLKNKFTHNDLWNFSKEIIKKDVRKKIEKEKNLKLTMQLNNIYVIDDYIFLDVSIENDSNISVNLDGLSFSIEDKKIYKSTNNQSISIKPYFNMYDIKKFKKSYRNVFVFEKFTFPNSKVLKIRLLEEQISGRTIELNIKYSDVLDADTF